MRLLLVQKDTMIIKVGTHNESTRQLWLEQALDQIPQGSRILDAGAGELQAEILNFGYHVRAVKAAR